MTRTVKTRGRDRTLTDVVRMSPVDVAQRRFRIRAVLVLAAIVVILTLFLFTRRLLADVPVAYDSELEHFKYGSIGSEPGGSLFSTVGGMLPPLQVFAVLPDMFPQRLPGGYASLGLLYESGRLLPIGISERQRLGAEFVGLNCAVCHCGSLRTSENAEPRIVPGMPSHQLDLQGLFKFVVDAVLDPAFTEDEVVRHVERRFGSLGVVDAAVLRHAVVPRVREQTRQLNEQVGVMFGDAITKWGRGRVDTFNPYKAIQFHWKLGALPCEELCAASDFPAIWNQRVREHLSLHWDGNNASLAERNLSAGLGAGITPVTADHPAIERVAKYIWSLPAPAWPSEFPLDRRLVAAGARVYERSCADCHSLSGSRMGSVVPLARVGTDPQRLHSYTLPFADNQNTLFPDSPYRFRHFHKTDGYVNQPLDGVWARAPYLHNGSVPTLADLLEPPAKRPAAFWRGCDLYDPVRVGFVSDRPADGRGSYSHYDTSKLGNSNSGHEWGVDLPEADKRSLLEYLKTL